MSRKLSALIAVSLLLAVPATIADDEGPDDEANYGLCTAQEESQAGENASNGTVSSSPAFENTSEEECSNATAPWNGTPGEEHVPEDPGEDRGNESSEDRGNQSDDRGNESAEDRRGEGDEHSDDGQEEDDDRRESGEENADEGDENRP